ncbi:hypothetical protein LPB41_20330 [Thalassospira sp. MA62]|nr:hypothetical protein [Thalassospira sp. MA62]
MKFSDYYNVFKYHGKGIYALGRLLNTFTQVHLFDLKRRTDTATIKTTGYTDNRYMIYMPVYTSVCVEMIRKSFEWYTSGIKYSNNKLIPVFVDLGAGAGKAVIVANESKFFTLCAGVELDKELSERSEQNIPQGGNVLHIHANVESDGWVDELLNTIPDEQRRNVVLFAFNKNSYDAQVVKKTIEIIKERFENAIYLYQNPMHHHVVLDSGFMEIQRDAQPNNAHKNFKYIIYRKSK